MLAALTACALVVGLAGPVSGAPTASVAGWSASGAGTTVVSDGSTAAAAMSYLLDPAGLGGLRQFDFVAPVTPALTEGPVQLPYTWQGYHAWFRVTARLEMLVDGQVVGSPLVDAYAAQCCASPSGGFTYGGVATFALPPGAQTFGFRVTGGNFDSDNRLQGTLTLGTKPYVDETLGSDNRQWTGALELDAVGRNGALTQPGEARWYKVPVVPGQHVTVSLTGLPADYDLALFGDIGAAFDRLTANGDLSLQDLTELTAGSTAGAPVADTVVPVYPDVVRTVPTTNPGLPAYAPRVYAPRVYAPRVYAPRVYAPRVYAPRVYAPDSYDPTLSGNQDFQDAFTGAQIQTLLAVSARQGTSNEAVSAKTGNTVGYYYVRVQGHDDQTSSPSQFHIAATVSGGAACAGLRTYDDVALPGPSRPDAETVIVTDTSSLTFETGADREAFDAAVQKLQSATDGAVVDVAGVAKVQDLLAQARDKFDCPYAVNLAAQAIKDVVDRHRSSDMRYVVILGNDEVVPFFRYPDLSGLGLESQFDPGLFDNNTAKSALEEDQVLSQDAYGSRTTLTIAGSSLPVPDLAVGRLVESPAEIEATIDHFVSGQPGSYTVRDLPTPTTSLVTGYDFLTDAAEAVDDEFTAALGPGNAAGAQRLISDAWTADDLEAALLGTRHDLVYLAGHFSANDTLAADFSTTLEADVLTPTPGGPLPLEDTLVLSAGCHSAYNTVNVRTDYPPDWAERMAQQHAVLVGGTGYQYGDTDFLEYSERLYLNIAKQLRRGAAGTAVPVGAALVGAKQDYLATLSAMTGIDQKAVLEATMYGLPMVGVDAAGRTGDGSPPGSRTTTAATTGPGAVLGLETSDLSLQTPLTARSKPSGAESGVPASLQWYDGPDGVSVTPGVPALPKQVEDVTVAGTLLRGVGLRSGTYTETSGVSPLTGAPAVEATTPHTNFVSPSFFPQRLSHTNYFDALGARGSQGRTSLVLTPVQYRSDSLDPGSPAYLTNTVRAYSDLGVRLFYGSDTTTFSGGNQPAQAVPPAITGVQGVADASTVTFSAQVTGDPAAGVQEVWATWTSGPGSDGRGQWRSVNLTQDALDSSRWAGSLTLPAGVRRQDVRFLVQAASGVGAVALDAADGDGYQVTGTEPDDASLALSSSAVATPRDLGVTARVTDSGGQPLRDRAVLFRLVQGGATVSEAVTRTGSDGRATMPLAPGVLAQVGPAQVTAELLPTTGQGPPLATRTLQVQVGADALTVTPTSLSTRAGTAFPTSPTATLRDARGNPVPATEVTFVLPDAEPSATFEGGLRSVGVTTDGQGRAAAPAMTAGLQAGTFTMTVRAPRAPSASVLVASQYALSPFVPPVVDGGVTTTNVNSTTPVKTSVLRWDGTPIDDDTAAGLVAARRIQVSWVKTAGKAGAAGPWTSTTLASYDSTTDLFQVDLKASAVGLARGSTYRVTMTVLAGATGFPDLGSRSFTLKVK